MNARPLLAATLALPLLLAGCTGSEGSAGAGAAGRPRPGELRVLAGSELADLRPILDRARRDTGVTVKLTFSGTIDGARQVVDGKAAGRYDAIWFSSNRYLALHPGAQARLGTAVKTMSSPVAIGVRASAAHRLGWDVKPPTWADIAAATAARRFTYGMTNPAASNSGFSALVSVAAALSGRGAALDAATIDAVSPRLRRFFAGQTITAGSSGWLSERYLREVSSGAASADGLINYESVLLGLNASGRLPEPMVVVRPRDGAVTADYPLTLLSSAPPDAAGGHRRLAEYLRRPDVQRRIMTDTHRRPVVAQVPPSGALAAAPPPELPFPARLDAVDTLLAAFFDRLRKPARTLYVLDTSGSMKGGRIAALRTALVTLTGGDGSTLGRLERFHNREEVTLIPFSTRPGEPRSYSVPAAAPEAELGRIRAVARRLRAAGDTAVYDSLIRAYEIAAGQVAADPDRFTSIVLMSDGENNRGAGFGAFRDRFPGLPEAVRTVPVFPILFGEAATGEMDQLARLTGGRTFDARSQPLDLVFREIRGYQ